MTDTSDPSITTLGVRTGQTVRLIGTTPELETVLASLLEGATVTTLASEAAHVGIIAVEDDNDLRERLFTELNGLIGAAHVWILSRTGSGPDAAVIEAEADVVAWQVASTVALADAWLAVGLQKK
jgi:hypothetical protein